MPTIGSPHPDLELGVPRKPLEYRVWEPSKGVGPDTGLIIYVYGWGAAFDDAYAVKLMPFLADKYDCVGVTVDYHGAKAQNSFNAVPAPDFFLMLQEEYGMSVTASSDMSVMDIASCAVHQLACRGVKSLSPNCYLIKNGDNYINFGVLSAIDNLTVLSEVISNKTINKRRVFVIGTSYGGYVAMLMSKFAPNTFRLVVDNSGFSGAEDALSCIYGFTGVDIGGVKVNLRSPVSFSPHSGVWNYFSPWHSAIRSLAQAHHFAIPTETVTYSYHSYCDEVAPTANKIDSAEVMISAGRHHDLRIIRDGDLDGLCFKDTGHGMHASMRGLFDLSYRRWLDTPQSKNPADVTDFDLGTINVLDCGDRTYRISFDGAGVHLEITR